MGCQWGRVFPSDLPFVLLGLQPVVLDAKHGLLALKVKTGLLSAFGWPCLLHDDSFCERLWEWHCSEEVSEGLSGSILGLREGLQEGPAD